MAMRKILATMAVAMPIAAVAPAAPAQQPAKPPGKLSLYKTADSAACVGDVAVWVDPATQLYYLKGDKSFGKTRRGGYSCRRQADAAGYRPFRAR